MRILIETIPHEKQRYPTTGDYYEESDVTHIKVSEMGTDDYNFLIALHEMVESYLCKRRGISEEAITAFDEAFEEKRQPGDNSEPGDAVDAPYQNEHGIATGIERIMAAVLGVKWNEYEEANLKLYE